MSSLTITTPSAPSMRDCCNTTFQTIGHGLKKFAVWVSATASKIAEFVKPYLQKIGAAIVLGSKIAWHNTKTFFVNNKKELALVGLGAAIVVGAIALVKGIQFCCKKCNSSSGAGAAAGAGAGTGASAAAAAGAGAGTGANVTEVNQNDGHDHIGEHHHEGEHHHIGEDHHEEEHHHIGEDHHGGEHYLIMEDDHGGEGLHIEGHDGVSDASSSDEEINE